MFCGPGRKLHPKLLLWGRFQAPEAPISKPRGPSPPMGAGGAAELYLTQLKPFPVTTKTIFFVGPDG